jgi:hypothetical protein
MMSGYPWGLGPKDSLVSWVEYSDHTHGDDELMDVLLEMARRIDALGHEGPDLDHRGEPS